MKGVVKANEEYMSLEVRNVPVPEVGPGDVLVEVRSTGLCYTDSSILTNTYIGRRPVPLPLILGHEAAGVITEVGPGVPQERIGERVALEPIAGCGHCRECMLGRQNMCSDWEHIGITRDGTFAEYISIPSKQAHRIGDNVDFDVATMTEPFGLVVRTLEQVKPMVGEIAVIIGPGSIGMMHLVALKASGLGRVAMVGLSKDAKRFAVAESLGADLTVAVDKIDAVEAIRKLSGGAGADIVVETASSPKATQLAFELAGVRGRVSLFGLYPEAQFSPVAMLRKGLQVYGDVAQVTRHFVTAAGIMASGAVDLSPLVTHKLPLDGAAEAFNAVKEGDAVKVLLSGR